MVNCAIVGCSNNSRKHVGSISYYRLPKNDMLKKYPFIVHNTHKGITLGILFPSF